ncbi:PEP-CTERM sorting domain-containing protein [Verrucomicrobiaceae bacterium N1E253]|uniref:PEP-CTERM sorting domain-containing protein n=1 Tax=Oceaniferula marina TaxID=2748318 RepID=A0A851GDW4_9BACT|nr:PEP-CTERM sorting domain-containing protein [Oceaniferula marina]NWK55743.1 PEP-CTERM sorting domain-containing protein [Oceaniferula marina]
MKPTRLTQMSAIAASATLCIGATHAAVVWQGADLADYYTGSNWVGGSAPTNGSTEDIVINNGTRADYEPGGIGDIVSNGTFTVSGTNSGWVTDNTNWSRFNGTTHVLNGGFIDRNAGGNLVFGSDNVGSGAGQTITLNVHGGSIETGGELWFGWTNAGTHNITVNISDGGSITSLGGGGASIFSWDAATFNFTGAGTVTAASQGVKVGANSAAGLTAGIWENQWAAGTLQFNGQSGLNGATFSDYFSTTGTNGSSTYTLTAVPEPSSAALLACGGLALTLRRRKQKS